MLRTRFFPFATLLVLAVTSAAQTPRDLVRQAVQTELNASRDDHSHWLYFEIDRQPRKAVKQWVAESKAGSLSRVVERDGQSVSESQQRQEMNAFIQDSREQAKRRKSGQHDDEQAAELLRILPDAFLWTDLGQKGSVIRLHFTPDPKFRAPDLEARVFAGMEGDMAIDREQHRIVSLRGRLIHDVKIGYGLLGELKAGGTFDVERRELSTHVWEITETHVHIQGHALIFKTISEEEDDVKTHFQPIAATVTLQQAQDQLLHLNPDPARDQAFHQGK